MNITFYLLLYMESGKVITINYHMALHIPDIIADYGPSHGYWCFSYERMNGILKNIKKNIELENFNRIMQQLSCTSCELQNIDELCDTKVKVLESFTSTYL